MKYAAISTKEALIYPVHKNLVDVFYGDGWENRTRFRRVRGEWVYLRGIKSDTAVLNGIKFS